MLKMKWDKISHRGGRKNNEDYCGYLKKGNYSCFLLADGLGGHTGGEEASRLAVTGFLEAFREEPGLSPEHITHYLESARNYLISNKDVSLKFFELKTTMVILLTDGTEARWAHIGDSRLYFFRDKKIIAQTKDHSVPQMMLNAGEITAEELRSHEDRNRLTRVFDEGQIPKPQILEEAVALEKGDVFLLCSDGHWEYILEKEMEELLAAARNPGKYLKSQEKLLLARVEPGHDNYSMLAVFVR